MSRRSRPGPVGRLLRQDLGEVDFGRRRFRLRGGPARERLEQSGRSFLEGFNAAVCGPGGDRLHAALADLPAEFRGFAYEGAGMGCAVLDLMTLSRGRRLRALLDGPGAGYPLLIHLGAGWSFARLGLRPWHLLRAGEPLLRWLALDGYGFHQGFFHADDVVGRQYVESGLSGVRRAVRDQGLGRSLWFHECADPEGVALRLAEFPPGRRADLWAGIGLAATYAGGAAEDELAALVVASGPYRAHVAQGSAFACGARVRSGSEVPDHVRLGARVLAGVAVETAAGWTDAALPVPAATDGASYQAWRAGIRHRWAHHAAAAAAAVPAAAVPAAVPVPAPAEPTEDAGLPQATAIGECAETVPADDMEGSSTTCS